MNAILRFAYIAILIPILVLLSCNPTETSDTSDTNTPSIAINVDESMHFGEGLSVLNQHGVKLVVDKNGQSPKELMYDNIVRNVDAEISSLDHFHNGLAVVMIKNDDGSLKWGYINKKGQNAFGKSFDYAGEFEEGQAIIKLDSGWGLIDDKGNFSLAPEYGGVSRIKNGNVWIKEDEDWKYVSYPKLEPVLDGTYQIYGDDFEGTFWVDRATENPDIVERAYANAKGEILSDWFGNATNFSEGFSAFEKDDKWGFVDKTGKVVIEPNFGYTSEFSEGLAGITTVDNDGFGKWGYINTKGETTIPMQFDFASSFKNGYAEVRDKTGLRGFINKKGELVVNYQYELAYNFYEGLAAVKIEDKWGFINEKGELQISPEYDKIPTFIDNPFDGGFSGGAAKVEVDGYEFFIDKEGTCIVGCLE